MNLQRARTIDAHKSTTMRNESNNNSHDNVELTQKEQFIEIMTLGIALMMLLGFFLKIMFF